MERPVWAARLFRNDAGRPCGKIDHDKRIALYTKFI